MAQDESTRPVPLPPAVKNTAPSGVPTEDSLQKINEEVYKHNLELALINKTLSLLRKLYQISLLELDPGTLGEQVSETLRKDLNLEVAGILISDSKTDTLNALYFSKSDRLVAALEDAKLFFRDIHITDASKKPFFAKSLSHNILSVTTKITDVWGDFIPSGTLEKIASAAHLKTIVIHPLVTQNRTIGVLLFGLNRDYQALSDHEKDSIQSITDVTAVALDKAYIYKELQDANEKLKSLDKLKTEFLSLASHQLRSPITAIKGYTSMLLEGSYGVVSADQSEAISRVFQSSQNLAKVVEDLLDVAKIEQGGMKYVFADLDLEKVTSDIYKEFSIVAKNKGLELTYDNTGGVPCMVSADSVKIRQVILNLLDNSIKYTPKGFVKISIRKEGENAVVQINDSGIGMSPETKEKLFGKFNRGGEGQQVNAGGSGLGLYLVKQIAEAHHGKITADSEGKDKGSTFTVTMPLKQ